MQVDSSATVSVGMLKEHERLEGGVLKSTQVALNSKEMREGLLIFGMSKGLLESLGVDGLCADEQELRKGVLFEQENLVLRAGLKL